ncbi:hypothetical protein LGH82_09565 [Mesorhizobium sp. PAMC28654]|uniref:hypothetical protein n=1 Tax=Mesorhizobium sp. PAMC28654 TaxID=2880934 RepID=UPI001D09EE6E|nr:hypothetical protein [Mesorhizobium sp. PAMC28654]UDL91464.1 hypothetical protein LGH82_09565 [Mesorhizobium sp. PAMC28654]
MTNRLLAVRGFDQAQRHAKFALPLGVFTALAVLLMSHGNAIAQAKPSFDCAKAASVAEKDICADPVLAQGDADVAKTTRRR